MIKLNTTKYINSSSDTSKYLTTKNIIYKKALCLIRQKHTGKSIVKKPSEEILGNILINLERSGKIGNLKGATKTTLLNNRYSYHSHCNKILKLKNLK